MSSFRYSFFVRLIIHMTFKETVIYHLGIFGLLAYFYPFLLCLRFFHQAKQKIKQEKLPYGELDAEEPDESTYRYDGPKPRFKESAIIFFADLI